VRKKKPNDREGFSFAIARAALAAASSAVGFRDWIGCNLKNKTNFQKKFGHLNIWSVLVL
jgi:hypothetical protein